MKKLLLGVGIVAAALSGSAEAATIVQSGPAVAGALIPVPIQFFDSNLGTLNSLTFDQTFNVTAVVQLTNTSSTSQTSAVNVTSAIGLFDPQSLVVTNALAFIGSADYHGSAPFSLAPGQSGIYVINSGLFSSSMSSGLSSILNALSAPGGGMFIADSSIVSSVGGSYSNISQTDNVQGSGTFSLTYNYTPAVAAAVPEPATWAMMILGMGAVGFAMRSVKRRSDKKFDAKIKRITYGAAA